MRAGISSKEFGVFFKTSNYVPMKFFNTQVAYIPQDYFFINVRKTGT